MCAAPVGPQGAPVAPQPSPTGGQVRLTKTRVYGGTLNLSVHWYNICGTDLGLQTSTNPRLVTIGPALDSTPDSPGLPPAVGGETNPVHLSIDTDLSGGGTGPDVLALISALRFSATSPPLILQYWNLSFDGTNLSGTLVDEHRAEAAAANQLFSPKDVIECMPQFGFIPWVWAVSQGSTLSGVVTEQTIQLHIVGNVVGGIRPFVADITATRVS